MLNVCVLGNSQSYLFPDDNAGTNTDTVKTEVPKQNGKTVRFQTETEQTYIHPETNKIHDNDMITKEVEMKQQQHENDSSIGYR